MRLRTRLAKDAPERRGVQRDVATRDTASTATTGKRPRLKRACKQPGAEGAASGGEDGGDGPCDPALGGPQEEGGSAASARHPLPGRADPFDAAIVREEALLAAVVPVAVGTTVADLPLDEAARDPTAAAGDAHPSPARPTNASAAVELARNVAHRASLLGGRSGKVSAGGAADVACAAGRTSGDGSAGGVASVADVDIAFGDRQPFSDHEQQDSLNSPTSGDSGSGVEAIAAGSSPATNGGFIDEEDLQAQSVSSSDIHHGYDGREVSPGQDTRRMASQQLAAELAAEACKPRAALLMSQTPTRGGVVGTPPVAGGLRMARVVSEPDRGRDGGQGKGSDGEADANARAHITRLQRLAREGPGDTMAKGAFTAVRAPVPLRAHAKPGRRRPPKQVGWGASAAQPAGRTSGASSDSDSPSSDGFQRTAGGPPGSFGLGTALDAGRDPTQVCDAALALLWRSCQSGSPKPFPVGQRRPLALPLSQCGCSA